MLFFTGNPLSVISNHDEIVLLIISDKILSFALELNKIKCPINCKQMHFYHVYGFICDFLQFPWVKSSKIFTVHRIRQERNFKLEKSRVCADSFSSFFLQIILLLRKDWSDRYIPEKQAPTKYMLLASLEVHIGKNCT